jgi:indolepyruvate ferredoxin oxidoreductase beta subunit
MQERGHIMKMDIIISGVGGQGNIFASLVISEYAMRKGYIVAGSETIGAAQRGGSVVSHIRISNKTVYAPLISRGQADLLIGMEAIEMLRHMHLLNPQGAYLLNFIKIPTVLNNMGLDPYPSNQEIMEAIKKYCTNGHVIDATSEAHKLGNSQMTNVILLGALVKIMPFFEIESMRNLILELSPQVFKDPNIRAFERGQELIN